MTHAEAAPKSLATTLDALCPDLPRPNFFVIGATKAGTTALWRSLSSHPEIFMSQVKEPRFFAEHLEDEPAWWAIRDPRSYLELFAGACTRPAVGEASTVYLSSATAVRRIRRDVPNAKLIAFLRQPVERAHSHYWNQVRRGVEPARSFERALALEPRRLRGGRHPWLLYRARGFYHEQLCRYVEAFGPERVRIQLYEDWRDSPAEVLGELCRFLGVDPGSGAVPGRHHESTAYRNVRLHRMAMRTAGRRLARLDERRNARPVPPIRQRTWDTLLDSYRADIERLQALLGRDLSHWLVPRPGTVS